MAVQTRYICGAFFDGEGGAWVSDTITTVPVVGPWVAKFHPNDGAAPFITIEYEPFFLPDECPVNLFHGRVRTPTQEDLDMILNRDIVVFHRTLRVDDVRCMFIMEVEGEL